MTTEHTYALSLAASGPWIAVEPNACATYGPMHHEDAPSLYTVYHDAFSTRPGTCLEEHRWISKWPHHALCVPSLSVVAVVAEEHVGYLLSYIDDERPGEGYIGQLGVKVAHRGRGIAQGMITTVLHGFEAVGLSTAVLSVAPDNHNAIRLYRRLGFERMDGNQ